MDFVNVHVLITVVWQICNCFSWCWSKVREHVLQASNCCWLRDGVHAVPDDPSISTLLANVEDSLLISQLQSPASIGIIKVQILHVLDSSAIKLPVPSCAVDTHV